MSDLDALMDEWMGPMGAQQAPIPSSAPPEPTSRDRAPSMPPLSIDKTRKDEKSSLAELKAALSELDADPSLLKSMRRSSSAPLKAKRLGVSSVAGAAGQRAPSGSAVDPAAMPNHLGSPHSQQREFLEAWGQIPSPLGGNAMSPVIAHKQTRLGGTASTTILMESTVITLGGTRVRCKTAYVGGSDAECGVTITKDKPVPCSSLRCTKCDMNVMSFPGFVWDSSTSYIFLRNTFPDSSKMRQHLQKKPGFCARACQCSWLSTRNVEPVNTDSLRWVCGGHISGK